MKKVLAGARMLLICSIIILYLVVVGIPVLTYCRLIRNPRLALRLSRVLDRMVLFFAGIRVEAEGLEKVPKGRGVVYVSNHRSHVDMAALFLVLPGDLRFLVKKEVFRIPLLSFALRTMGMIEVDRSNKEAAVESIERAIKELSQGRSIILFPEGTRSRTNEILPFKKGAFVLAIKASAPIVPVTLIGADQILLPDTILLYPGRVNVIVHEPIFTEGCTLEDREGLRETARQTIAARFVSAQ